MANQNASNDDQPDQSAAETARLNRSITSTPNTYTGTSVNADLPGRRLKNPLGDFASYTYQLSLYIITPDAYQLFTDSGRKNINALQSKTGGAFIVAQSGGVNTSTNDRRAPGMKLDYYIDDLSIKHLITGKATESAINITSIKFAIIEPYGFSFNTQLMQAFETIKKNSKIKNYQESAGQYRQFFILGIKFQGYNADGTPATPDNFFSPDTFNPSASASGVFERFFDIKITSIKFKIDGTMTRYAVEAATAPPQLAFGQKYGVVDDKISITADTAGEALTSLMNSLNKNQQGRSVNNQYAIAYLGEATPIKNASMINPGDVDKAKRPGSNAQNSAQVNEATASTAIANNTKRIIEINNGTSVAQAIEQIIKQSSYLRDALTTIYTTQETPNEQTASPNVIVNKNPRDIQWYNLGARVETLAWDNVVGDFSYRITYVIQPYKTPSTYTPYGKTNSYYGPHKRYNYWFTGKNSEILEYSQTLDNLYYNIVQTPSSDPNSPSYLKGPEVASVPNKPNDYDRTNSLDISQAAENQYLTSLYSPGNWADATIKILGDPDFLMNDSPGSLNEVYRAYYGNDGFTINPNGGQVFVEINFNEGRDYNNNTGLLKINEAILFWAEPNNVPQNPKINGIAYLVTEVESVFSGGGFTQKLKLNHSTVPYTQNEKTASDTERENNNTPAGDNRTPSSQGSTTKTTPSANGTVSQSTGFVQDDAAGVDAQVKRIEVAAKNKPSTTNPPAVIPTNFGIVADDDSTAYSGTTQAGKAETSSSNNREQIKPVSVTTAGGGRTISAGTNVVGRGGSRPTPNK
jgi:hypothetical protein